MATGNRNKRSPSPASVLVTIGCFALVVGAIYVAANRTTAPQLADTETVPTEQHEAAATSSEQDLFVTDSKAQIESVSETNGQSADAVVSTDTGADATVVVSEPNRLELVSAQLAAGEFGPALETARSSSDAREQTQLFKMIAEAQIAAGEFDSSLATIRRMPIPEERMRARGQRAMQKSLTGGGAADPAELIELIMENTSGPWEEDEGEGGVMTFFSSGVQVDPNGMMVQLSRDELNGRLDALGVRARVADLNSDMAQTSPMRMVSLTRLEREVAKRLSEGQPVLQTMKNLAGLSQIRYVFVYPEEGEIVIAGPAEGWQYDENGFPIGIESGHPTVQLDDLVTVLRTFTSGGAGIFRCSIDPRPEGLQQLNQFVAKSNQRGPLRPSAVKNWVRNLGEQLGLQNVSVYGVPAESRVARVIVEADYRMKLIGIGKLDAGEEIASFFDLLPKNAQNNPPELDALRWWLTMKYDAVLHSPDHNVFEMVGSSVRCQSENELIGSDGKRIHTGKAEATNRLFAANFTQHYAELAQRDPIFADMQNIFDLALVAALVRHEQLDERIDWNLGVFDAAGAYRPTRYDPAESVMSVVNHRVYKGKDIVVQVAGGVRGDLMSVIEDKSIYKEGQRLEGVAQRAQAPQLPEGRWWWDAAE